MRQKYNNVSVGHAAWRMKDDFYSLKLFFINKWIFGGY
jgi:hypothetical protein